MLAESLRTGLLNFLPNLRIELALRMSCSVVLRIGTVPSGHNSPDILHNWKFSSENIPPIVVSFGLSGGSYINIIPKKKKFLVIKNNVKDLYKLMLDE